MYILLSKNHTEELEMFTPPTSPRERERRRLRDEALGTYAPASQSSAFFSQRETIFAEHIADGLAQYDQGQAAAAQAAAVEAQAAEAPAP